METPNQQLIKDFIQEIKNKKIPYIDNERLNNAFEILEKYPLPEGFFSRLLQCFDYINQEEFENDLNSLNELILENIPGVFNLIHENENSSNDWIFNQLSSVNELHPSSTIITNEDDDSLVSKLEITLKEKSNENFVVIDDWSITGSQIREDILRRIKKFAGTTENCTVFLTYATQAAVNHIIELFPNIKLFIANPKRIKILGDFLTDKDLEILQMFEQLESNTPITPDATLTTSWWSIPDNIPDMFRVQKNGIFGIIDDSKLEKPY